MYRVIKFFTDLQDKNHLYDVGDVFPREENEVSEKRLIELSGEHNRQGVPLIELVAVKEELENKTPEGEKVAKEKADEVQQGAQEESSEKAEEPPKKTVKRTAAK